jgi:hypothetical protein
MTRKELYDLVWSKPMTHIGKEYGMSDVAVRKHCKKHRIPTPPVGYWTKIAHGKKVRRPKLPTKKESANTVVQLKPKPSFEETPESKEAEAHIKAMKEELEPSLSVTEILPDRPHNIVRSLRAALRKTKKDKDGFVNLGDVYRRKTILSPGSTDRTLRILQALASTAESLGHHLWMDGDTCYWKVEEEIFEFKIYEVKAKKAHTPTGKELKEQARHDKWSSGNTKIYRTWDYVPSGRLAFHITDMEGYWRVTSEKIERRWRDRENTTLDSQLVDIFVWLSSATIQARTKRLLIEDYRRKEAEEEERRRRARQKKANAKELKKHIDDLTDTYAKIKTLSDMASYISNQPDGDHWASQRFIREVLCYRDYLATNFQAPHMKYVCEALDSAESDTLMKAVYDKGKEGGEGN